MSTGFTVALYEGEQSFREFVLRAACAFFYDTDQLPLEVKPNERNFERLAQSIGDLAKAETWDADTANVKAEEAYQSELENYQRLTAKTKAIRGRYKAMLKRVKAWQPPTPRHRGLKDFMTQQLEVSLVADCFSWTKPKKLSGEAYKAKVVAELERDVERNKSYLREDIENAKSKTDYISDLRESLAR